MAPNWDCPKGLHLWHPVETRSRKYLVSWQGAGLTVGRETGPPPMVERRNTRTFSDLTGAFFVVGSGLFVIKKGV